LDDASVKHHGGLTDFGREVVREMNRLGMMVDVSHVSDATFWDVMQTTHAPVLASHSCSRALTNSARNLTDEQMRAIATSDGAVMVNFYPAFVDERWRRVWKACEKERDALREAVEAEYREHGEPVPYSVQTQVDRDFYAQRAGDMQLPGIEAVVEHIDYVAKVAGIDHVGLGSDFDGFSLLPEGIASAADLPKLTAALMERGYTAEQMKKILGGNLLRVMATVQAEARTE
jgi:membrane dipeptidase